MSDNWQAGDMALCVREGAWVSRGINLRKGQVHKVVGIYSPDELSEVVGERRDNACFLMFAPWQPDFCFGSSAFRKITPEEPDEFDREVIEALSRQPEQVPA